MSAYDKNCFSLNIRAMQILRNNLYVYAYDRIRNFSCAKDFWDAFSPIYLPNNEFVHKIENSLKEAYSPQKDVQGCEMSSMMVATFNLRMRKSKMMRSIVLMLSWK